MPSKVNNAAVNKKIPHPMSTNSPSSSSIPSSIKKIDHAAVRFDRGIGKGRASKSPSRQIMTALAFFIKGLWHTQFNLGWTHFFDFLMMLRVLVVIFCRIDGLIVLDNSFFGNHIFRLIISLNPINAIMMPKGVDSPGN